MTKTYEIWYCTYSKCTMKNIAPLVNNALFIQPHNLNFSVVSIPEIVMHLMSNAVYFC